MQCRKEEPGRGESTKFWRADDVGDVELLYARYRTHSFGRHTHEGLAVGVILLGVEHFSWRGSGHHATTDQIIVFNPDEVHTGEAADSEGWAFRMFYFDAKLLQTAASFAAGRPVALPAFRNAVIDDPELAGSLRRLHETLETEDPRLKRQEMFLLTIAQLAKRHGDSPFEERNAGSERAGVRIVREYLDANTDTNVALSDLAQLSGLSPYYLVRAFRSQTGLSPHAYFEQVRVNRAKQLLKSGRPIIDVALELGFTDQSHLNRHFKKLTGVTPGLYRSAISSKTHHCLPS